MDAMYWEEKYYNELDADERKAMLDKRIEEEGMTEELEFMMKLLEFRFVPVGKEQSGIDHMLKGMAEIRFLKPNKNLNSKTFLKERAQVIADLGIELANEKGELSKQLWYKEMKNVGRSYIQLCVDDRGYSSYLWGLGKMGNDVLRGKLAADICNLGYIIPQKCGMTEDLGDYANALRDSYYEMFPKDKDLLRDKLPEEAR